MNNKKPRKYATNFIQHESSVPDGYQAMHDFVVDSYEYKAVSRAQKKGLVRAVKLVRHEGDLNSGAVWVHKGDARAYLSSLVIGDSVDARTQSPNAVADFKQPSAAVSNVSRAQADCCITALCEINDSITLMQATLERLTTAVESVVTQPKYEQQLRREIHAACDSTNGFHN